MNHPYVGKLNEIGFMWRGEEMEVVGFETFQKEKEKTEVSKLGTPVPYTVRTRFSRIELENDEEVEMEFDHVRQMIERAEDRND